MIAARLICQHRGDATPMADPKIVDSFAVEVTERDGFSFVGLKVLTSDQQVASFELAPAFAYELSNQLLRSSAAAAPKSSA
jgi:hypothetical protein